MYVFSELKNSFDINKWFATLGSRVTDVLTRSDLLISEDITFIDTLIDSQTDFQTNKDCLEPNHTFLNKNVLMISISCGLLWFESRLASYKPLFGSIICYISWKLSSLLYNLMNKIYLKRRLIDRSIDLSERLTKERNLIKKYFKLIEDYEVVEESGKHLTTISEMKDKFRNICWKCFKNFRQITIDMRHKFPLNSEIDEEINYLCCFPTETFDKFISEDKNVITLSTLKSLMHLKRLQQSECFRRIICLFLTICLDKRTNNQTTDQYIRSVSKEISRILDHLIEESKETYPQLLSDYNCAKSLWISSEKSLIKCRDFKKSNETIESINLLNTNRSIRKHLLSSLNILDDCDSLIEDGIHSNQFRNKVRQQLDSITAEFKCLNDLVINLEKSLRIEELRESNSKPIIKNDSLNEKPESLSTVPKFEEYVVRDQVFEAIVTEEFDESTDLDSNDDQLWEMRLKLAQESDASDSLFRELKVALKSKAVEHQKREAKALGIDFNEISNELKEESERVEPIGTNMPSKSSKEQTNDHSKGEENRILSENKLQNQNQSLFSPNSYGFESQLASIAAQKALLFASNKQTENFGDDSDTDSEASEEE